MMLFVFEMFIFIKGNVCMLHGPMGEKSDFHILKKKKKRATLTSIQLFDLLLWCSVRQSHMMYFIALPQNKNRHGGDCNVMV